MQPVTLYPDAELVVIDFLRTAFLSRPEGYTANVIFGNRVPEVRPYRFVKVKRNGGVSDETPTLDAPRIDIEAWAQDDADAHDIAALCHALIYTMPNRTAVRKIEPFLGLTRIEDPLSHVSRVLFTLTLRMRGTPFNL